MVDLSFVNGDKPKRKKRVTAEVVDFKVAQVDPFDVEPVRKRLEVYQQQNQVLLNEMMQIEIVNDADLAQVNERVGQAKNLNKRLEEAAKAEYSQALQFVSSCRNILNVCQKIPNQIVSIGLKKMGDYGHMKEVLRRKAEAEAARKQAELQKKLDKVSKEEGVPRYEIQDKPQVPKKVAVKTESGSVSFKTVWDFEIKDLKSTDVFGWVLKLNKDAYAKLVANTMKKAIKAGIRDGIKGIRFYETTEPIHRRR